MSCGELKPPTFFFKRMNNSKLALLLSKNGVKLSLNIPSDFWGVYENTKRKFVSNLEKIQDIPVNVDHAEELLVLFMEQLVSHENLSSLLYFFHFVLIQIYIFTFS